MNGPVLNIIRPITGPIRSRGTMGSCSTVASMNRFDSGSHNTQWPFTDLAAITGKDWALPALIDSYDAERRPAGWFTACLVEGVVQAEVGDGRRGCSMRGQRRRRGRARDGNR